MSSWRARMTGDVTTVAGIQIPSTDPLFLAVVGLHIVLGLTCVVSGAVAMLSMKGPGRHSTAGKIYYWSLGALFASATVLSAVRWAQDEHLFFFGLLAFAAAHLGRRARRRQHPGWPRWHVASMGVSH